MSINECEYLGVVPIAETAVVLPLTADVTGTWAFMTTFNGAYKYVQFNAVLGQKFVVPALLNEDYLYNFKLYKPDTTLFNNTAYCINTIPLVSGIEYVGGELEKVAVGKLQYVATEGQTQITDEILQDARQVALFVEGAILQEGSEPDGYAFNAATGTVTFHTPLIAAQRITILYIK